MKTRVAGRATRGGFTLIELLVLHAVVLIITALALPGIPPSRVVVKEITARQNAPFDYSVEVQLGILLGYGFPEDSVQAALLLGYGFPEDSLRLRTDISLDPATGMIRADHIRGILNSKTIDEASTPRLVLIENGYSLFSEGGAALFTTPGATVPGLVVHAGATPDEAAATVYEVDLGAAGFGANVDALRVSVKDAKGTPLTKLDTPVVGFPPR